MDASSVPYTLITVFKVNDICTPGSTPFCPHLILVLSSSYSDGLSGSQDNTILIVAIVVPIAAVIIIVAIVLLAVPQIRKKIFPYRDRESFRATTQD